jgi:hypothetical protein
VEKEILVEKEVKTRENHITVQRPWRNTGRQIQGYLKPSNIKRSRIRRAEVLNNDGTTWTKVEDKEDVENHLIERNVEQFSHAGATSFG